MTKSPKTPRAAKAQSATRTKASKALEAAPLIAEPAAPRPKSKLGTLVDLLSRPEGTTIEAMTQATGWQAHTVRGAMSGAIKKKLSLTITSDKVDGVRIYGIAPEAAA